MKRKGVLIAISMMVLASCNSIEKEEISQTNSSKYDSLRIDQSTDPLSQEEAVKVAQQFVLQKGIYTKSDNTNNSPSVFAIDSHSDNPEMFVVNFGENGGFVIVNASKKYFPVLAYSETGHFAQDREASGLDVWLEEQRVLIDAAKNLPLDSLKEVTKQWRQYESSSILRTGTKSGDPDSPPLPFRDSAIAEWELEGYECMDLEYSSLYLNPYIYNLWCDLAEEQSGPNYDYMETAVVLYYGTQSVSQVGPFLTTTWGRWSPYNTLLPTISGQKPPAGCSVVAMAQIMRYYEWPTSYNWSSMSNNTATGQTQLLIYDLGEDAETNYGLTKSSTRIRKLKSAITGNKYRYNATVVTHSLSMTKNNINSGKPVFMQGVQYSSTDTVAHAWVCDGRKTHVTANHLMLMLYTPDGRYLPAENGGYYSDSNSTDYLSMNWGEDGYGNGWYYEDNVNFTALINNTWISYNLSSERVDMVNITPDNY